jgi:hypothetical protein
MAGGGPIGKLCNAIVGAVPLQVVPIDGARSAATLTSEVTRARPARYSSPGRTTPSTLGAALGDAAPGRMPLDAARTALSAVIRRYETADFIAVDD